MGCFTWLLLLSGAVFAMVSLIRWFEQTTEAVEQGWWNKVLVLLVMPFSVWFFPSRVSAGRPTPVPRHEPVRGFGAVNKTTPAKASRGGGVAPESAASATPSHATPAARQATSPEPDGPPPGTPKEFLGMPVIPPKKKSSPPAVDPEKLAKLRQKMRDQGMLDGD